MTRSASAPSPHASGPARWLPNSRSLLWVLLAFLAGLALFALAILRGRDGDDFYRPGRTAPPTTDAPQYQPLPAPLPAEGGGTGNLRTPEAPAAGEEQPRLVEAPKPPAPVAPAPRPAPAVATRPEPIPGQTPAPRYPAAALRRGESGTVMVRAEIRPDGTPDVVTVARSSGSRQLDRAALDAVRRWRFRPAQQDGQPVRAAVMVPISFEAQR